MDSIDSQLALALVDNTEFEEKVDIKNLVFPPKSKKPTTEFNDTVLPRSYATPSYAIFAATLF